MKITVPDLLLVRELKESANVLLDSIEIHTVELGKYNGSQELLRTASVLEQSCYWINHSHEHSEDELRELLPGLEFLHATRELRKIQEISKEKQMYHSREKGYLDWQSSSADAHEEGLEEGMEQGIDKGREEGETKLIRTLQEILNLPASEVFAFDGKKSVALQAITASLRDQIVESSQSGTKHPRPSLGSWATTESVLLVLTSYRMRYDPLLPSQWKMSAEDCIAVATFRDREILSLKLVSFFLWESAFHLGDRYEAMS